MMLNVGKVRLFGQRVTFRAFSAFRQTPTLTRGAAPGFTFAPLALNPHLSINLPVECSNCTSAWLFESCCIEVVLFSNFEVS